MPNRGEMSGGTLNYTLRERRGAKGAKTQVVA